jgi:hypothetical protein
MTYITVPDAQAWLEGTKLALTELDAQLETQISTQIISRLSGAFDTTSWVSAATTPPLIVSIIAMTYASWLYSRTYSEDGPDSNEYALRLLAIAEINIAGLSDGTLLLPGTTTVNTQGTAMGYPNDESSAMVATYEDPSLGGSKFSMGTIW